MVVHSKPKGNTFELMFASQFFAKILSKGDNFSKMKYYVTNILSFEKNGLKTTIWFRGKYDHIYVDWL